MIRRMGLLAVLLATACSSAPVEAPPPPAPVAVAPPAAAPPASPPDRCGAYQHRHLIGRPRSEIPVPVDPARQRVACTTCPVTQDFREDRLNFFFDAETGIVKDVRCG